MSTVRQRTALHLVTGVITAATALSAYAGVVGLVGGGISFGEIIDARLPFGSLWFAGVALLLVVALPMTVATVVAWRASAHSADAVLAAGLLLVAWIAVELAYIKAYSWFHPTYLAVAVLVLGLGWRLGRRPVLPHSGRISPSTGASVSV